MYLTDELDYEIIETGSNDRGLISIVLEYPADINFIDIDHSNLTYVQMDSKKSYKISNNKKEDMKSIKFIYDDKDVIVNYKKTFKYNNTYLIKFFYKEIKKFNDSNFIHEIIKEHKNLNGYDESFIILKNIDKSLDIKRIFYKNHITQISNNKFKINNINIDELNIVFNSGELLKIKTPNVFEKGFVYSLNILIYLINFLI